MTASTQYSITEINDAVGAAILKVMDDNKLHYHQFIHDSHKLSTGAKPKAFGIEPAHMEQVFTALDAAFGIKLARDPSGNKSNGGIYLTDDTTVFDITRYVAGYMAESQKFKASDDGQPETFLKFRGEPYGRFTGYTGGHSR